MTQEQIIAGNKLIAEFMGWRFVKWCGEGEDKLPFYQRFEGDQAVHDGIFHEPSFNDWDSLMPVVENIEQMGYCVAIYHTIFKGHTCKIYDEGNYDESAFIGGLTSKIETVWMAVVAFIEWYNKTKEAV